MPRYNIEYNGKWACFTSISDGFITEFMDKSEYEEWRKAEYGRAGYRPLGKHTNLMTMKEAVVSIRLNRTSEEALETLLECGLPESECKQLLYDMETEYYCPIPKDSGKFACPNCNKEVDKQQKSCKGDDCMIKFIWRE